MDESRNRTALTVVLLSVIAVASRLMGFVREQIIASGFGISAATDAFVSAQLLPTVLDAAVGAAMAVVVVPLFTAAKTRGREDLSRTVLTATAFLAVVYSLESIFLWIGAPLIMRVLVPGLGEQTMNQGVLLARVFSPWVMLVGLSNLYAALLNVHRHFLVPGITASIANVSILVAAVIYQGGITVEQVAWAVIIGNIVQITLIFINVRQARIPFATSGFDWTFARQLVILGLPLILANAIAQMTPVLDKFFASQMAEGSIAALNYAFKLVQLPVGVLVMGLSTVLYARFAKSVVDGDRAGLEVEVGRTLQGVMFVMFPATALMAALSDAGVALAFQRGQFNYEAVIATSGALSYYAFGLLPMAALPILSKAMFALKNTRAQLVAGLSATGIYMVLALLLGPIMAHKGLALAFAVGQYGALGVLCLALRRELGSRPFRILGKSLPVTVVATGAAFVAMWLTKETVSGTLAQFMLGSLNGAAVYVTIHMVCRTEESQWIRKGFLLARRHIPGL